MAVDSGDRGNKQLELLEQLENPARIDAGDPSTAGQGAASQPFIGGGRMQRTLEKYQAGQLITLDELITRVRGE